MSLLVLLLGALELSTTLNHSHTGDDTYHAMPRFWTNTGFCPAGGINHRELGESLLSPAVRMNIRYIGALPHGAVTHIRIHWLLELIQFEQFTPDGVPMYDFTQMDTFIMHLDNLGLYPVIEFMANPGDVFNKNPNRNGFLWQDFSYQVIRHYLSILGASKLEHWRFESLNEPDVPNYNRLQFSFRDYLVYLHAVKRGMVQAGHRPNKSLRFTLRGPAGLFKSRAKHPLCWRILKYCNFHPLECPFDTITYHKKGNGTANSLMRASKELLHDIFGNFTALRNMNISNDEADPITGWSIPQPFHEDVRYALILTRIVLQHWSAKLQYNEFRNLESISHDNAFLSYHPHEFSQRTLLAHFRMNETQPVHSQFIQKPVYAVLGMLAKLAPLATDLEVFNTSTGESLQLLKTTVPNGKPLTMSWLLLPPEAATDLHGYEFKRKLPFDLCDMEMFAYIVETLDGAHTNPAHAWHAHGSPPYPNKALRELMRHSQTPRLYATGILNETTLAVKTGELQLPWVLLIRVCSNLAPTLRAPMDLSVTAITIGEVLITWRESANSLCLKSYQVWFQADASANWTLISQNWHLPFPSYHFAPSDNNVNGFYMVRGEDIFNNMSAFSVIVEYIEI